MVRLLGVGKHKKLKRRTPESLRDHQPTPTYQYALNEYAQTVAPGSSNDDGNSDVGASGATEETGAATAVATNQGDNSSSSGAYEETAEVVASQEGGSAAGAVAPLQSMVSNEGIPSSDSGFVVSRGIAALAASSFYSTATMRGQPPTRSAFENDMPFASYEELYGEAYTGGSIRYIYPNGYTSMRPRSCPWKLSIVVCLLFTWLSVFIVGHCANEADTDQYTDDVMIDDTLAIEIRWCGSRPLYLIWALSMLITGLSAAYCGVIGYIKCRDFAVANSRSQPPGVSGEGKSDYYVRIEDGISPSPSDGSMSAYRPSIYQADGTPQFWGSHIYRPTQAAVAITSR